MPADPSWPCRVGDAAIKGKTIQIIVVGAKTTNSPWTGPHGYRSVEPPVSASNSFSVSVEGRTGDSVRLLIFR